MMMSILIPSRNEAKIWETIKNCEAYFPGAQVISCNDREGKGKGWAVREALQYAKGDIICFIDGDMDIHPRMILRLIPFLEDYDIVVGRKIHRHSLTRRFLTVLSRLWTRALLNIKIDTQTGVKVFNRQYLHEWETDGFMFDVEIIAKAFQHGAKIIEVPVEVETSKKAKPSSIWKCVIESIKIKQKLC